MIQTAGRKEKRSEEPTVWSISIRNSGPVRTAVPGELALNDRLEGCLLEQACPVHGGTSSFGIKKGDRGGPVPPAASQVSGPVSEQNPSEI